MYFFLLLLYFIEKDIANSNNCKRAAGKMWFWIDVKIPTWVYQHIKIEVIVKTESIIFNIMVR